MPPSSSRTKCSWSRNLFYDHPVRDDGSHFYGAQSAGKVKVYCIRCFESGISELQRRDDEEVAAGTRQVARTKDELDLFSMCYRSSFKFNYHSKFFMHF